MSLRSGSDGRLRDRAPRGRHPARRGAWLAGACLTICTTALGGSVVEAQSVTVVETRRLQISIEPARGAMVLAVRDSAGTVVHRAELPGVVIDGAPVVDFVTRGEAAGRLRAERADLDLEILDERSIAATWTPRPAGSRAIELRLLSDDETAYYGTGERFNALNQRGYVLPVITDDRYGNKGVGTHKPIPFFMSTRGFGVWVDGHAPSTFDLSGTERFLSTIRLTDSTLRVVFIAGPTLAEILDGFTALTGRPRVPPPWAFGLWKSRDVHHNRDSVLVDVELLRRHRIPASVLVLDSPWETGYNDFEVNREQFTEADAMFQRIERLGFRLALWLTPFINSRNVIDMRGITPASRNWDEAVSGGHLVRHANGEVAQSEWWKGVGGLVDFTDPAADAWWHAQLRKMLPLGVRAFKADDGEGNFVPDAVFHDGSSAARMKNRYAALYNQSLQRFIDEELDGDGVLITRSGFTGTQRFPFAWAGDNRGDFSFADGLPSVIIAGQNAALSGIPMWGSDIAGYAGRPTKEVFIRWTQFGAFSPFMQVHMTSNLGPWSFDEETLEIFREFTRLRTQLFPYLYDAAHEAARTGMPIIRPMVLAFQSDPEAHRQVFQYLFGPDLLVAPMYQAGASRSVYLPAGAWRDYWTGARLEGPRTIEAEAPLARMPLYVREGAMLVRLPEDVQTLVARHARMDPAVHAIDDRRIIEVWPGDAGEVRTWDGISARLTRSGGRRTLRVISERERPIEIRLVHRGAQRLEAAGSTTTAVGPDGTTRIIFPSLQGTRTITWTEGAVTP